MARTESKVIQVHPDREQSTIEFWEIFHWNLANSQHVKNKTATSHLERRGDSIYSVTETETEHFVSLTFSRDLDLPGIDHIKVLEAEYHSVSGGIPEIPKPSGYVAPIIVCVLLLAAGGMGGGVGSRVIWTGLAALVGFLWFRSISGKNARIEAEMPDIMARREQAFARLQEIEEECRNVPTAPPIVFPATASPASDDDLDFWDRMDKSDTDQLQEYLIRHPSGRFVELARAKLERAGVAPL